MKFLLHPVRLIDTTKYIPTYFENDKKSYFSAIFDGFLENFDKI